MQVKLKRCNANRSAQQQLAPAKVAPAESTCSSDNLSARQANRTSEPHQTFPVSSITYTHQNARSGARQNSAGGGRHLRRFSGRSQRARGKQGGRLDLSAWAGRHLPPLEKGVHMLGQCVGPHSERRRRRFRRFRARGAAAAGCGGGGAPVLRLSQNFPPLTQKN